MKIELLLIGSKLFDATLFHLEVKDTSSTRLRLRRGRKIIVFELVDSKNKMISIAQGLVAKKHLAGTNLTFKTEQDATNFDNKSFIGEIIILVTIFDQDTFLSHSDKIKQLNERFEQETQKYFEELKKRDADAERKEKNVRDPLLRIIQEKDKKIHQLLAESMVAASQYEERIVQILDKAIGEQYIDSLGITKEQLLQQNLAQEEGE